MRISGLTKIKGDGTGLLSLKARPGLIWWETNTRLLYLNFFPTSIIRTPLLVLEQVLQLHLDITTILGELALVRDLLDHCPHAQECWHHPDESLPDTWDTSSHSTDTSCTRCAPWDTRGWGADVESRNRQDTLALRACPCPSTSWPRSSRCFWYSETAQLLNGNGIKIKCAKSLVLWFHQNI